MASVTIYVTDQRDGHSTTAPVSEPDICYYDVPVEKFRKTFRLLGPTLCSETIFYIFVI